MLKAGRRTIHGASTLLLVALALLCISGCAVTLPENARTRLSEARHPYGDEELFTNALDRLAEHINQAGKKQIIVTVKPILNTSSTAGVPYHLSTMVEGSINRLIGRNFHVLPIDTFLGVPNLYPVSNRPTIYLAGGVTRYDKNVEILEKDSRLDLLFGGGDTETDTGLGLFDSYSMSSISATMYLTSARSSLNLPGENVENTIDVLKATRKSNFGFVVHGSGLNLTGRIEKTQGLHKAVKNLIDLCVLQLFSRLYNYPYWLDLKTGQSDKEVCKSLLKTFKRSSRSRQIRMLQGLLGRAVEGPVINPMTRRVYMRLKVDGKWGPASRTYAVQFAKEQDLHIPVNDFVSLYSNLLNITKR